MSSVLSRYRFRFSWTCLSRNRTGGHRLAQCPPFWGLCHRFPKQLPSNVHRFQLLSVLTCAGCWLPFCYSHPSGCRAKLRSLLDRISSVAMTLSIFGCPRWLFAHLCLEQCRHPNLMALLPPAPLGPLPPTICSVIFLESQINTS